METRNIWEIKIAKEFVFFKTIDEVINAIKEGKIKGNFKVTDGYDNSVDRSSSLLEEIACKNNTHLNYIDDNHQAFYHPAKYLSYTAPIFGTNFFNKYKNEIIDAFKEQILSEKNNIYVNEYLFSDELFEKLLNYKDRTLFFCNIKLSEKQIKKLQDNFINAYLDNKQISKPYVLSNYTMDKVKTMNSFSINPYNISDININNLIYLPDNCKIIFASFDKISETEKLKIIKDYLDKINNFNKPFTVQFKVNKRSLLEKSGILSNEYKNLNIIIENDLYEYKLDEFKEEEKKLNNLIKDIKDANLSPYEKYIAIYNIVKNYKPYKESSNKDESRYLRYILDNDFIVCVGYAKLLETLLDKVGTNTSHLSVGVDSSYEKGFSQEEIPVNYNGHARVLVNMDDDKYNIHGIYVADPTWDYLKEDFLNYSLTTIDKMQTDAMMFWNTNIISILDVHSFEEFKEHFNQIFKKLFNKKLNSNKTREHKQLIEKIILDTYSEIISQIEDTFINLDYDKWNEMYSKYKFENEKDYTDFLTELGHHIVERVNKPINSQKTIKAHLTSKKELLGLKRKELAEIRNKVNKSFYNRQKKAFPYYLTDKTYIGEKDSIARK